MNVQHFFHPVTYTLSYIGWDEASKDAFVVDPVLDYNPRGSKTSLAPVKEIEQFVKERGLRVRAILETHAHADHLSGCQYLKRAFDAPVFIGSPITEVQKTFKGIFDLPDSFPTDGSQFDRLLHDGDDVKLGALTIHVIATPGHTPACVSYLVDGSVFTGDALFMDDYGTGRCDFPKGSAKDLYHSVHKKLYQLPDDTRVFVGHDYLPNRSLRFETTIGASKQNNPQLRADTTEDEFVRFRRERDAALEAPNLLFQSVQVNIDAGQLPEEQPNRTRYLKVPVNLNAPTDRTGTPT